MSDCVLAMSPSSRSHLVGASVPSESIYDTCNPEGGLAWTALALATVPQQGSGIEEERVCGIRRRATGRCHPVRWVWRQASWVLRQDLRSVAAPRSSKAVPHVTVAAILRL